MRRVQEGVVSKRRFPYEKMSGNEQYAVVFAPTFFAKPEPQ